METKINFNNLFAIRSCVSSPYKRIEWMLLFVALYFYFLIIFLTKNLYHIIIAAISYDMKICISKVFQHNYSLKEPQLQNHWNWIYSFVLGHIIWIHALLLCWHLNISHIQFRIYCQLTFVFTWKIVQNLFYLYFQTISSWYTDWVSWRKEKLEY